MSTMNPVVLISCPNLPYFLGTFDTTNFKHWWRSAPFPEAIQSITKGLHIYGRSHLCIAKKTDGLWAVYRSKNYGIDWERVWQAEEGEVIYDIILIIYGRAIMNTSAGFYETVNAGTTWSKVSSLPDAPNAPAFCNIGGGDVLLCTDGRYIWRSTDIARTWAQVCDSTMIELWYDIPGQGSHGRYSNISRPCIAGACGRVLASAGPYLLISEDGGITWASHRYWHEDGRSNSDWYDLMPPYGIVAARAWPPTASPKFLITQIIISSIDGPKGDDVQFLLRCDDLQPVSGESRLYSRVFTTYGAAGHYHKVFMGNMFWRYLFQQYITPTEGSQISAYDLPVTGAAYNDKLAFSAQVRTDPATGELIPSLKYSQDGGQTWIDIDLNNVRIANSDGSPISGGSALDDNFAKLTWTSGACDNYGSWNFTELYRRQCISQELDAQFERRVSPTYDIDVMVSKAAQKEDSLDIIAEKPAAKLVQIDALCETRNAKSYSIDRTLEGTTPKQYSQDAIISKGTPVQDLVDAHFWSSPQLHYKLDFAMGQIVPATCLCDMILLKNKLPSRLSHMEKNSVQILDLDVPDLPYDPLNSRKQSS